MSKLSKKKREKARKEEEKLNKQLRPTILKRKAERKLKRETKKQMKKQFFAKKAKKMEPEETPEEIKEKKMKTKAEKEEQTRKEKERHEKRVAKAKAKERKEYLLQANIEEQKNIKRLEKQLGYNRRKSKNLPKSFKEDGLDYLLGADGSVPLQDMEDSGDEMGHGGEDSDDSEDQDSDSLEKELAGDSDQQSDEEEQLQDNDNNDEESDNDDNDVAMEEDDDDEDGGDQEDDDNDDGSDDNDDNAEQDEDDNAEQDEDDNVEQDEEDEVAQVDDGYWEDIYGRKRSKDGRIVEADAEGQLTALPSTSGGGKYVPPALRRTAGATANKKKELERLAKQLKGNLNRLAEQNMHSIAVQIENMYRDNSRNDMNQTLYDLLSSALISNTSTPERLVMEHVMLIAILHANIGSEVGAHFLEEFVKVFNSIYLDADLTGEAGDKQLDNLILILSYTFNFRIVASKLIFDLLNQLAESFQPKDIELILVALRSSGFGLRKEDAAEMKSLIVKLQNKAAERKGEGSRVQFMLDILLAVKNNNVNKIPNYDPSHFDHLKKILKTFIRDGNFITELKIGLQDLKDAETRGRWWVVGSFFKGNLAGDDKADKDAPTQVQRQEQFSEKLLKLARRMRMNTDSRKNIFCLVMSAEDYIEATERLIKLGLKNQVERDIMFVLLDCTLQEAAFNPFYSQVAIKLSTMDRKYKIANQFAVWDKIKISSELTKSQLLNLAKCIGHLIRNGCQQISVLRVVEFADMNKPNLKLLRTILCDLLLQDKEEDVAKIFQGVATGGNLSVFREGLRLFLTHFLLKNKNKLDPGIDAELLERRVKFAEIHLNTATSKLKL